MIPPRTFYGENMGIGVHNRVSACRRRLRVSRSNHRTNANPLRDQASRQVDTNVTRKRDRARLGLTPAGAPEEAEGT
jgi:hypothetical protein